MQVAGAPDLLQRSLAAVWHPCTQMQHHLAAGPKALPLLPVVRGQGVWLYGEAGQRWLDGISSWWTNLFGHANPRINAALREQLDQLEHVMLAGFTHEPVVALSERLSALTGGALGTPFMRQMVHRLWRLRSRCLFTTGTTVARAPSAAMCAWRAAITAKRWARWP